MGRRKRAVRRRLACGLDLRQVSDDLGTASGEGLDEEGKEAGAGNDDVAAVLEGKEEADALGGLVEVAGEEQEEGTTEDVGDEQRGSAVEKAGAAGHERDGLEGGVSTLFDGNSTHVGRARGEEVVAMEDQAGVEQMGERVQEGNAQRRLRSGITCRREGPAAGSEVLIESSQAGRGNDGRGKRPSQSRVRAHDVDDGQEGGGDLADTQRQAGPTVVGDVAVVHGCRQRNIAVGIVDGHGTAKLDSQCAVEDVDGPPGPPAHLGLNERRRRRAGGLGVETKVLSDPDGTSEPCPSRRL